MNKALSLCLLLASSPLLCLSARAQQASPPAAPILAPAAPAPLAGDWSGALTLGGSKLLLIVHFTSGADKTLHATFDSPDQGATGLPFSSASEIGSAVHLEAPQIRAVYDGTLDASGKTIAGHWMQSGASLPLTLTRSAAPITVPIPPDEPKLPYPYESRDVAFPGGAPGVTLAGTLTVPKGTGPFPAIVLISGSGPNDRDEHVLGHKPFLVLADSLTRRGIAVLRYDKRGIGKSTGSYVQATSADFAGDAQAAVAYLGKQPGAVIDARRIGLLGHSEGGLIAPMVASRHPGEIAFIVLLAAPAMSGEKILLAQGDLIARADGASAAEVSQSDALQRELFALVKSTPDPAVLQTKAQAAILRAVSALSPSDKAQLGDPALYAKSHAMQVDSPWFRYFLTYDPLPALREVRCPVLALDGSKDLQVPPAEDLAAIKTALQSGGNAQVTVKELPNLNHLFQPAKTGSPSEYAQISETMAPVALTTIRDWVAAQTIKK